MHSLHENDFRMIIKTCININHSRHKLVWFPSCIRLKTSLIFIFCFFSSYSEMGSVLFPSWDIKPCKGWLVWDSHCSLWSRIVIDLPKRWSHFAYWQNSDKALKWALSKVAVSTVQFLYLFFVLILCFSHIQYSSF